jgi:serine/threonine protein kinase
MSSADDMYLAGPADRPASDDYWKYDAQTPRATPGYASASGGGGTTGTGTATSTSTAAGGTATLGGRTESAGAERASPGALGAGQWRARRLFKLDDLERLHVLGHGFFSEVSLVADRRTGDKYALKSLKAFTDAGSRLAFIQETEMLRMLHHPNIVRQRGVFVNATGLHVLTDYVERGTLRRLLKSKDVELSDRHKVHYAHDIALGMQYLHAHSVMHRDLKSKNCLVNEGGRIVIADFGLAKHLPSPVAQSSDQAGTAYWMAPEMLKGQSYGLAADVFSYGIVLAEIITRLKAAPTEDGIPRLASFGLDVARFRECAGACLPALVDLAVDCCRMDQAARPSFDAIVARLEQMVSDVDAGQPPLPLPLPPPPTPAPTPAAEPPDA